MMLKNVMFTFGSGGHSTEMLSLIQNGNLMKKKGIKNTFLVSEDDKLVCDKLIEQFKDNPSYHILKLRRGRRVGQSYLSSIWTVLLSFIQAIEIVVREKPRLLITNGPAISVIICLAIRLLNLVRLNNRTIIIYVESFCRTKTLSLSGKLLYHLRIVDTFLVQWSDISQSYSRVTYRGLLV